MNKAEEMLTRELAVRAIALELLIQKERVMLSEAQGMFGEILKFIEESGGPVASWDAFHPATAKGRFSKLTAMVRSVDASALRVASGRVFRMLVDPEMGLASYQIMLEGAIRELEQELVRTRT